jgi:hypothetical protein
MNPFGICLSILAIGFLIEMGCEGTHVNVSVDGKPHVLCLGFGDMCK